MKIYVVTYTCLEGYIYAEKAFKEAGDAWDYIKSQGGSNEIRTYEVEEVELI